MHPETDDNAAEVRRSVPVPMRLWRGKWLIVGITMVTALVVYFASQALPKTYQATATLWISQPGQGSTFDAVQAGAVLARTYGDVAQNRSVAEQVAAALPFKASGKELLGEVTAQPITETQLLNITASSHQPARAQMIANTYATVLIRYSRNQLRGATTSTVAHATAAPLPSTPSRPKPTLYALVGGLVGLLFGAVLVLALDYFDRRVGSAEDVASILGVPVLARIPPIRGANAHIAATEAYRLLRVNLQFAQPNRQLRSIAVVSAVSEEGKSSTAIGLARAFAEAGQKVILVDADMRRPSLHRVLLDMDRAYMESGLSTYLAGVSQLADVVFDTEQQNLRLIPSGPLPPAPPVLIQESKTHMLVDALGIDADLVIFDTPPLTQFGEATAIASLAQVVVVVVDLNRMTTPALGRTSEQLAVAQGTIAGIVVNRSRESSDLSYGYYGHAESDRFLRFFRRRSNKSSAPSSFPTANDEASNAEAVDSANGAVDDSMAPR